MTTERFFNLLIKKIPEYNPTMQYEHGDLFYDPTQDKVFMFDKYKVGFFEVAGEVRCDVPYLPSDYRLPIGHLDVPQVTYRIHGRGTGKEAIIAKCMPDGWNKIKKVIFNNPATIVFWQDGTKTVVKCTEGESYDPEKGLMAAIAKKAFGNLGNYYNQIKKWLPEEEGEEAK